MPGPRKDIKGEWELFALWLQSELHMPPLGQPGERLESGPTFPEIVRMRFVDLMYSGRLSSKQIAAMRRLVRDVTICLRFEPR